MEYHNRAKNRKLKRNIILFLKMVNFKSRSFSLGEKISIFWVCISFIALFFNWVNSINNSFYSNAFWNLSGKVGYFILWELIFILFLIFSQNKKVKFKMSSNFHFRDSSIVILVSLLNIVLSLNVLSFVQWLSAISTKSLYGNGIILCITSSIVLLVWWILMRKERKTEKYSMYTNDLEKEKKEEEKKEKNMKLPF